MILLLGLTLGAPMQVEPPVGGEALEGCRRCDHRGVVDCSDAWHGDVPLAWEADVLCSVAAACPSCGGALVVDCPKCDGGPESAAMAARRAELQAFAAEPHPALELLGPPVMRVEGPHLELAGRIRALRGPKKKDRPSGHRFLHEALRESERAADLVDAHFGFEVGEEPPGPIPMWFWQDLDDHVRVLHELVGATGSGDLKRLDRHPLFSVCTADDQFQDDYVQLVALAVHTTSHLMMAAAWDGRWVGDQGAAWLDEGAAHWYEEKVLGERRHLCVEETYTTEAWEDGLWRAGVRKYLDRHADPVLPRLLALQLPELRPEEHALAWSVYDWLVTAHPEALPGILRAAKAGAPAREWLRDELGLAFPQAEEAWRDWVDETYPRKEKRPKRRR